jgi:hypothetical protein
MDGIDRAVFSVAVGLLARIFARTPDRRTTSGTPSEGLYG